MRPDGPKWKFWSGSAGWRLVPNLQGGLRYETPDRTSVSCAGGRSDWRRSDSGSEPYHTYESILCFLPGLALALAFCCRQATPRPSVPALRSIRSYLGPRRTGRHHAARSVRHSDPGDSPEPHLGAIDDIRTVAARSCRWDVR